MKNVKVLDCTLRDGGRIINCNFQNPQIHRMIYNMQKSGLDIIEVGFLRNKWDTDFNGNSTFFTDVKQITPYIPSDRVSQFVAFIDLGMFDFSTLSEYDGTSVDGIRLGFTKKDLTDSIDALLDSSKLIKEKGYRLFLQGVNSLNYSDMELLELIQIVNKIEPYSFGIVDTYGAMYVDDVQRLFTLIDHNLNMDIAVDFHSHNNMQLSFCLAQEIIMLSNGVRSVIIDGTLRGMGKGAGNANTELIINYLNRKKGYKYDLEGILEIIDLELFDLFEEYHWGYSPASFMAGVYKSHPNNITYLLEKYKYDTNDIRHILSQLSDSERERYNYEKIDLLCEDYKYKDYNDISAINQLIDIIGNKDVLVLAPGKSISLHSERIFSYVSQNAPVIFSVNFIIDSMVIPFFGNKKRYSAFIYDKKIQSLVTSDIANNFDFEIVISSKRMKYLCQYKKGVFQSSLFKLLNLLAALNVKHIAVAGMDGYTDREKDNYYVDSFYVKRTAQETKSTNDRLQNELKMFISRWSNTCKLQIITPSIYCIESAYQVGE